MAVTPEIQQQFMYLFERVGDPLYFGPRGAVGNLISYNLPPELCPETQHASTIRKQSFANLQMREIRVDRPTTLPNLSGIGTACPKSAIYNYFNPNHRRATQELRQIMLQQPDLRGLLSMACVCRDSEMINPKVWITAFASCLLTRPDTRGFRMPAIWEVMPDMFFSSFCLKESIRQGSVPQQDRAVVVIEGSFTGRNNNVENRLAYFREDLGINAHHWHWHLIYTLDAPRGQRDRKGELFFMMHREMLARYEAERLANNLTLTKPLKLDEGVIKEGYFPKLTDSNSGQLWGNRQQNSKLSDVNRLDDSNLPQGFRVITLEMMRRFRGRILEAIDSGMVITPTGRVPLTIDMLGDIIESSSLNPNPQYYGDLHNMGHVIISATHDPEFKHSENLGVMSDTSTAMRDVVFYRWHKYIDDIFDRFKQNLNPYNPTGGEFPLAWEGIQVESAQLQTKGVQPNVFSTFRMRSNVDLSRGMDFLRIQNNLGPVFVRVVHLNHDPYTFTISVRNNTNAPRTGTVRIFMAPRLNEHNEQFPMVQQRRLFFQLDKFTTQLSPGVNGITRRSSESSVTIPWEQTFRDLERSVQTPAANEQTFCGCGWPEHMVIPRGTATGQLYDVVVFITDGNEDRVEQPATSQPARSNNCRDAVSYCGVLDQRYPDRKPMGYPFDRNPYTTVNSNNPNGPQIPVPNLETYVSRVPNMRALQVRVVYNQERVEMRNDGVPTGMREVNGDPYMNSAGRTACSPQGNPPRPAPGSTPTGGGTRPSTMEMTPARPSPPREPIQSGSSPVPNRVPPPTTQNPRPGWSRQYQHQHRGEQRGHSPSPSPIGWTHIPSPERPSSPNWGWGWRG
ncbi:phenoloxidase 2 [Folsomia candida]|uniref:phenoloxidase 2 n=1 Tax=Folsomia candida TaxID=158441 RepID=UPI000B8F94CA|nr:phenoloxidase 2 [Folsomia candida]